MKCYACDFIFWCPKLGSYLKVKILAVKIRTFRYTTIRLHVDAPQNDDQQQAHLKFEIHTWTATEIEKVGKKKR